MTKSEPTWVRELRAFLRDQKEVQAIRISPEKHTVSVATFGKTEQAKWEDSVKEMLKGVEVQLHANAFEGAHLSIDGLWVRSDNEVTVVEKTQCPTVRTFWTWRDYEWPTEEHTVDESDEEWRWMAKLAGICGISLFAVFVAGFFEATPSSLSDLDSVDY